MINSQKSLRGKKKKFFVCVKKMSQNILQPGKLESKVASQTDEGR